MKLGSKVIAAALLFVGLVLVNYLAAHLPARVDTTSDKIYTLSNGTKSLLKKVEEPIQLDLYFSKSVESVPIIYKNFATRVQEMLRQYVRASNGRIHLNVIDPKPDTPDEEKATAAGLTPQMLGTGEKVYFGLVATQADQQKTIPVFSPQREQFLEYDLSQLIYTTQEIDKKKLGLITSLPLRGAPQNPMMMMRQRQGQEPQFVLSEWERTFEIVSVEGSATELPANLDALAVIHPQNLSPKLQYAIDQFIMAGKPVFIAVDPSSQYFKRQGGQMAMFGGPQPNVSSDLPELFKAYGVTYNPQMVVGDLVNGAMDRQQSVRYPTYLFLGKESFSSQSLPTAQLNSIWFIEPGDISVKSEPGLTVTPLMQSSDQSGEVQAMAISMSPPEEISRQITPSGKKTIAALIQGKLKSAFPNGAPEDPKPEPKPGEKAPAPTPEPAKKSDGLKESKGTSTLIVVADTDWLLDDFSVQRMNFAGVQAAQPLNDNLAFASNSLEFLSGSQDLISIRGKGSALRPFTVVKDMEVKAQKKYQDQLTALEAKLSDLQKSLTEAQGQKEGNRLIASPEVSKKIEGYRKQEAEARAERRQIRKALREDIETLGNELLAFNLLASPVLLIVFGVWFYRRRHQPA